MVISIITHPVPPEQSPCYRLFFVNVIWTGSIDSHDKKKKFCVLAISFPIFDYPKWCFWNVLGRSLSGSPHRSSHVEITPLIFS